MHPRGENQAPTSGKEISIIINKKRKKTLTDILMAFPQTILCMQSTYTMDHALGIECGRLV
jgi:hypothetical protein